MISYVQVSLVNHSPRQECKEVLMTSRVEVISFIRLWIFFENTSLNMCS